MEFNPELDYNADTATYKRTRKGLQELDTSCWHKDDIRHLEAMKRDCEYAIEWLEKGRRPGNKRGVERLAAYQREIPFELMERYAQPVKPAEIGTYDIQAWEHAEYILSMLTDRERECYEMNVGGQYSTREIGRELGITMQAVCDNVKRAQNKIKRYKTRPVPVLLEIVI